MIIDFLKAERKRLSFLLIVISLFVYCMFYLFPQIGEINSMERNIQKYKNIKDESLIQHVKINEIDSLLPNIEKNSEIAYNVKIICDKYKIILKKIGFGDIYTSNNFAGNILVIPIKLEVSGDIGNLNIFFCALEKEKRICEVGDVNISATGFEGDSAQAIANIKYYCRGGGVNTRHL